MREASLDKADGPPLLSPSHWLGRRLGWGMHRLWLHFNFCSDSRAAARLCPTAFTSCRTDVQPQHPDAAVHASDMPVRKPSSAVLQCQTACFAVQGEGTGHWTHHNAGHRVITLHSGVASSLVRQRVHRVFGGVFCSGSTATAFSSALSNHGCFHSVLHGSQRPCDVCWPHPQQTACPRPWNGWESRDASEAHFSRRGAPLVCGMRGRGGLCCGSTGRSVAEEQRSQMQ